MNYHAYFRRPDDCVVYAPVTEDREISLVHRGGDGRWHCALCDATDCRHVRVAVQADGGASNHLTGAGDGVFTVPLPNG